MALLNIRNKKTVVPTKEQQQIPQLLQRGLAHHQRGEIKEAQAIYDEIIKIHPKHFDALQLSATVASQKNDFKLAIKLFESALAINPKYAEVHYNRGTALLALKRYKDAMVSFDHAIALKAEHFQAYHNRGIALQKLNQYKDALANYDLVLAKKPNDAQGHYQRGNILTNLNKMDEALVSYDRAISINPNYLDAHINRGITLRKLKRLTEALASFDLAIHIKPEYSKAYNNRGNVLRDLKRMNDAIACYDRAIEIKPDNAEAHSNRGAVLTDLNQLEDALSSLSRAVEIKANFADAYFTKSIALLKSGNFKQGWDLYEWRWKVEAGDLETRQFAQTLWLGKEDITNKTILLHAEQGFGDTIQFCRFAKLVKSRGARVLLEVPKALLGLLETLEGVDALLEKGKPLPAFDYHCPLLSLPFAFKTEPDTVPVNQAYLSVESNLREEWTKRLGDKSKPRIGLVWSGRTGHKNDHNRSLPLSELMTYLPQGFDYVSLQKEVQALDRDVLVKSGIKHYGEQLNNFTDTAALCYLMDLVLSVDTSVAHLSGAIGKPTWILLPFSPDWRWMLDRDDSPWYPKVKLYRQEKIGEWAGALKKIKSDLIRERTPEIRTGR